MKNSTATKSKKNTPAPKGEDTRQRLAESAFLLFSEIPMESVTLDMIADSASVTKGAIYCHYRSKKELLLAACECYYRRWERTVVEFAYLGASPLDQLRKAVVSSAELCLFDKKNRFFTAQLFALALTDADVKASWGAFYSRARDFFAVLLTEISKQGPAIFSPAGNANRLLSIMEGVKQQAFLDPEICSPGQIGEVVEFLMSVATKN